MRDTVIIARRFLGKRKKQSVRREVGKEALVQNHQVGEFVIEIKTSSDCEQSSLCLGLSLGLFGKIYFPKNEILRGNAVRDVSQGRRS